MRFNQFLCALPLALAACGGSPPPDPTPVAINTPPPSTPAESGLVAECQGLFAQALGGQAVTFESPAIASAGGSTTIHLAAQPITAPPSAMLQYTCSFSGTALTASGLT